jgi:hypothetical protein
MPEVVKRLIEGGFQGVADLYVIFSDGVEEAGSSSINPKYAEVCDHIRALMKEQCGVIQRGEGFNAVWKNLGDNSAILYFGGFKTVEGERRKINAQEYIELLSVVIDQLTENEKEIFNELCAVFAKALARIPNPADTESSKH